jgi:hypothetical protein
MVPSLDFQNLNYVAGMPGSLPRPVQDTYLYNGPSTLVRRIAVAVAAQDTVLPIEAPSANSTWNLKFRAPSIHCDDVTEDHRVAIEQSIYDYLIGGEGCKTAPLYMAWFPRPTDNGTLVNEPYTLDVDDPKDLDNFLADADAVFGMETGIDEGDSIIMNDTTFFAATFPGLAAAKTFTQMSEPMACQLNTSGLYDVTKTSPLGVLGRNATVLQCHLVNSTYLTNSSFESGSQSIGIKLIDSDKDEKVLLLSWINGPRSNVSCQTSDTLTTPYGCSCLLNTHGWLGNEDSEGSYCDGFDTSLLRQMAYQGVLQAFSALITGHWSLSGKAMRKTFHSQTLLWECRISRADWRCQEARITSDTMRSGQPSI